MTHVYQHQRSQQAGTSSTKAGQPIGCASMRQCGSNWLKRYTGQDCLR